MVLGKAKVISYEDLEEARAKRTAKEKSDNTAVKGKRCRKRQRLTPEVEPEIEVAQMNDVPKPATALTVLRRAPVARMY